MKIKQRVTPYLKTLNGTISKGLQPIFCNKAVTNFLGNALLQRFKSNFSKLEPVNPDEFCKTFLLLVVF